MAKRTDYADYDDGETFENVQSPLSDTGHHENYYGRHIRTSFCIVIQLTKHDVFYRAGSIFPRPTTAFYNLPPLCHPKGARYFDIFTLSLQLIDASSKKPKRTKHVKLEEKLGESKVLPFSLFFQPRQKVEELESVSKDKVVLSEKMKVEYQICVMEREWTSKLAESSFLMIYNQTDPRAYFKQEQPHVLAIQELKCAFNKIPKEANIPGYSAAWNSAEKEGYAGTGVFYKDNLAKFSKGIGIDLHDSEGRSNPASDVPNSGRGLVRLQYRDKSWDPDFKEYLKRLDAKKPVILCGDLNVSHQEIGNLPLSDVLDLANPESNRRTAGFTDEERAGFSELLADLDFVDTYRYLYPQRRAYTYWTYMSNARSRNVGWRLDYFLVSRRFLPSICDHEIRCGMPGSDHCPIVLYLDL
ncbi:unnamed protein product [Protopolystoma xenopodis]|uniref:DNA-(apurinic or apyrimidinic site) endonuclease n=1 Tax=Protopolystoma xenopodis TaxID=117903 RepID=A0A3S5FBR1_9PLAT|nr:unnamed protein product [Protopolystoma xenopodis]